MWYYWPRCLHVLVASLSLREVCAAAFPMEMRLMTTNQWINEWMNEWINGWCLWLTDWLIDWLIDYTIVYNFVIQIVWTDDSRPSLSPFPTTSVLACPPACRLWAYSFTLHILNVHNFSLIPYYHKYTLSFFLSSFLSIYQPSLLISSRGDDRGWTNGFPSWKVSLSWIS